MSVTFLTNEDKELIDLEISQLSKDIADLKKNGTGTGNGATTAQANSLWAIIQKSAFAQQLTDAEINEFKTAWGIGGEVEPDIPDEPIEPDNPEVTLTSISATYTGGEVAVGTSVNSLTGITVKAHYSDGSTSNVTGYTLSGTITEGSNTITVSYDWKTTTITVMGYVKETRTETLQFVSTTSYPNVTTFEYTEGTEYGQYSVAKQGEIKGGTARVDFDNTVYGCFNINFYVFDSYGNPYCQTDKDSSAKNTPYNNFSGDMGEIDWEGVGAGSGFGIATAPFSIKIPDGCTFIACMRRYNANTVYPEGDTNSAFSKWVQTGGVTITVTE